MRTETDKKLEELIHRELSKLPQREAPENLIPRVMQAIQARRQLKWWQRPWTHWPVGLQIASLPVLCLGAASVVTVLTYLAPFQALQGATANARDLFASLGPLLDFAAALVNGLSLALGALTEYWFLILGGIIALMYGAFIGLGTVCYRLAASRR
jgi:hypothetical protein